jgi:hypothetical protein
MKLIFCFINKKKKKEKEDRNKIKHAKEEEEKTVIAFFLNEPLRFLFTLFINVNKDKNQS